MNLVLLYRVLWVEKGAGRFCTAGAGVRESTQELVGDVQIQERKGLLEKLPLTLLHKVRSPLLATGFAGDCPC